MSQKSKYLKDEWNKTTQKVSMKAIAENNIWNSYISYPIEPIVTTPPRQEMELHFMQKLNQRGSKYSP